VCVASLQHRTLQQSSVHAVVLCGRSITQHSGIRQPGKTVTTVSMEAAHYDAAMAGQQDAAMGDDQAGPMSVSVLQVSMRVPWPQ
jgi:hypothetical protein